MLSIKKKRKSAKRSLTGCRTCRARHIKCDETSVICNNCASTGRRCDYDLSRLPVKKFVLTTLPLGTQLAWETTSDEKRCFAYFTHCSIPSLTAFFDSPLWQKLALQVGRFDRAVYHAANMVGALHEDSNLNQMRLSGVDLRQPRHRFALEQASRAFAILSQRQASNDPELREVALLCCLLFVISDVLLTQYDNAFQHLRGGLQILKETKEYHLMDLDDYLVRTFERLDIESSHFGPRKPFLFSTELEECNWPEPPSTSTLYSSRDVQQAVTNLLNLGIPFLAQCWLLSAPEIKADYSDLYRKQHALLSSYSHLKTQIELFYAEFSDKISYRDKRGVELSRLQCLGQILSLKTCLIDGPVPIELVPEYINLLVACEAVMAAFPERPTITMDYGINPCLYVVALRCPEYSVRWRAINALLSWPHCEGVVNSNVVASICLEAMKAELTTPNDQHVMFFDGEDEEQLRQFLFNAVKLTQYAENWPSIRAAGLLDTRHNPPNNPILYSTQIYAQTVQRRQI